MEIAGEGKDYIILSDDDDYEYTIDWEDGRLMVSVRDLKTKKYVFDKTFDTVSGTFE